MSSMRTITALIGMLLFTLCSANNITTSAGVLTGNRGDGLAL